jgi:hypothetical protein
MSKKALLKAREFETDGSGRLMPITGLDKVGDPGRRAGGLTRASGQLRRELKLIVRLRHPGIPCCYNIISDPSVDKVVIGEASYSCTCAAADRA